MKEIETKNSELSIIAGHCSLNPDHLDELYEMAEIQVRDGQGGQQKALNAVRFVGLKSRAEYNETGEGMGIDFPVIDRAIMQGVTEEIPPSVILAQEFIQRTNMGIASEIMVPLQVPFYEGIIPKGKLMLWNPSTNQLGWSIKQMAVIASRNDWTIGLKNGKSLDKSYEKVIEPNSEVITSMERTWKGLATFTSSSRCNLIFIHRGVDVPDKGENRNALVHEIVRRLATEVPSVGRYLDPSHSLGPNLRDKIVETTIEAMKMRVGNGNNDYLYNGILIEAGTSKTDTDQHISVSELRDLVTEVSKFRKLKGPSI